MSNTNNLMELAGFNAISEDARTTLSDEFLASGSLKKGFLQREELLGMTDGEKEAAWVDHEKRVNRFFDLFGGQRLYGFSESETITRSKK